MNSILVVWRMVCFLFCVLSIGQSIILMSEIFAAMC